MASGPVDAGPPIPGLPDPEEARRRALEELRRMGGTPVDPGDKNVNGKLSPELIQGVILASFGVFHACYKSGLVRDPNLQGVVQTRFVINPDGSVTSSTVSSGTTMADPKVVECIVAVYRTLKFPPPPKGTVTVVFPMKFGGPQD